MRRPAMRPRSGYGFPAEGKSGRPTICSQGIDRIAEEHVEVQRAHKHFNCEKRTDCLHHKIVNSIKRRRRSWSQEEDKVLIEMVNLHSSRKWSTIACSIPGRSPQQCQERWKVALNPAVNRQPWSEKDDITLIHAHEIHGSKWCEMAKKYFPGRTGKAIMNRWITLKNKKAKSHSVRGLPKGPSTNNSGQDSSSKVYVSSEMPVPKLEQGLAREVGRDPSTLNDFPRSGQNEEVTDSVPILRPNTDFSPARNLLSNSDHSDEICNSADSESQEPHLANLADLLDMSYCESLMIIPPHSPEDGNDMQRM